MENAKTFVIIKHDHKTNDVTVCYISDDYSKTLIEYHKAYDAYLREPSKYICKETSENRMLVIEKQLGYVYDSECEFISFKLCQYKLTGKE